MCWSATWPISRSRVANGGRSTCGRPSGSSRRRGSACPTTPRSSCTASDQAVELLKAAGDLRPGRRPGAAACALPRARRRPRDAARHRCCRGSVSPCSRAVRGARSCCRRSSRSPTRSRSWDVSSKPSRRTKRPCPHWTSAQRRWRSSAFRVRCGGAGTRDAPRRRLSKPFRYSSETRDPISCSRTAAPQARTRWEVGHAKRLPGPRRASRWQRSSESRTSSVNFSSFHGAHRAG